MDSKLTLLIDNQVIVKAKFYARQKNTSLSKLIESYLQYLTSREDPEREVTPLVKSISGVLKSTDLVRNKDAYKQHLSRKYSGKK